MWNSKRRKTNFSPLTVYLTRWAAQPFHLQNPATLVHLNVPHWSNVCTTEDIGMHGFESESCSKKQIVSIFSVMFSKQENQWRRLYRTLKTNSYFLYVESFPWISNSFLIYQNSKNIILCSFLRQAWHGKVDVDAQVHNFTDLFMKILQKTLCGV